jgi:ABC-type phosphate transport system ATPase subunit
MRSAHEIHAKFRSALGKFTLKAVFTVPATGITVLFGPSGCGKMTVLRCIARLIHVKDGLCAIAGEVWQGRSGAFVATHNWDNGRTELAVAIHDPVHLGGNSRCGRDSTRGLLSLLSRRM